MPRCVAWRVCIRFLDPVYVVALASFTSPTGRLMVGTSSAVGSLPLFLVGYPTYPFRASKRFRASERFQALYCIDPSQVPPRGVASRGGAANAFLGCSVR